MQMSELCNYKLHLARWQLNSWRTMRRSTLRVGTAWLCGIALTALPAVPRPALAAPVELSGQTKFTVSDCASFSFTLRFISADAVPLAVRTNDPVPATGGQDVSWTIDWQA